jgi:adenosyl cobinamide kinase/adenosyl cobinamide phosphate guanylyltransferase
MAVARTLVLGGVRSGKSAWAESLLTCAPRVRYLATAQRYPDDPDWVARIAAHQQRRPRHWSTTEVGGDPVRLTTALGAAAPSESLLVDDVGNWLTAALDAADAWTHDDGDRATDALTSDLVDAVASCPAPLVLVSPDVGAGVLPATRAGRIFADAQGRLNQRLAGLCDAVTLVVAGLPLRLK